MVFEYQSGRALTELCLAHSRQPAEACFVRVSIGIAHSSMQCCVLLLGVVHRCAQSRMSELYAGRREVFMRSQTSDD